MSSAVVTLIAALAIGLLAAVFVLWPLLRRRDDRRRPAADDLRASLEAEKVLALRAIRELTFDREAGHLTDEDYAGLRARHEARASAILKRLDELGPSEAAPAAAAPAAPAPAKTRWSRHPLALAGGAVVLVAFGVVLGVLVVRYTQPDPSAATQGPTGGMAAAGAMPGMAAPGPVTGGETGGESARPLAKEMLDGMLRAAHAALDEGRYPEAIAAYKAILKRDPENVEAITHIGVILGVAGHAEGALEAFDRALALRPDDPHTLWDKARVLYDLGQDYAGAIAAWERFVKVGPPGKDRDEALAKIREARARLAAAPPVRPGAAKP